MFSGHSESTIIGGCHDLVRVHIPRIINGPEVAAADLAQVRVGERGVVLEWEQTWDFGSLLEYRRANRLGHLYDKSDDDEAIIDWECRWIYETTRCQKTKKA